VCGETAACSKLHTLGGYQLIWRPLGLVVSADAGSQRNRIRCRRGVLTRGVFTESVRERVNCMVSSSEVELKLEPPFAEAPWPIAELELELSRGSLADRFALRRPSDCLTAPKTELPTKSGRGYASADGDQPTSFKAAPIVLQPDMPTAETFRVIVRACVQHFRLNETLLIANGSAESLHQARVAIRRLRSALSLFRSMAEDQEYEGSNAGCATSRTSSEKRAISTSTSRGQPRRMPEKKQTSFPLSRILRSAFKPRGNAPITALSVCSVRKAFPN
jgi:hypothetical protein